MREYLEDRDASEREEESDSGEATIDCLSDYNDEDYSEDGDGEEEGLEEDDEEVGEEETHTETEDEVVADESLEEEEYEEANPKNKMKKLSLYRIATPPPSPLPLGLSQSSFEMLPRIRNHPLRNAQLESERKINRE